MLLVPTHQPSMIGAWLGQTPTDAGDASLAGPDCASPANGISRRQRSEGLLAVSCRRRPVMNEGHVQTAVPLPPCGAGSASAAAELYDTARPTAVVNSASHDAARPVSSRLRITDGTVRHHQHQIALIATARVWAPASPDLARPWRRALQPDETRIAHEHRKQMAQQVTRQRKAGPARRQVHQQRPCLCWKQNRFDRLHDNASISGGE